MPAKPKIAETQTGKKSMETRRRAEAKILSAIFLSYSLYDKIQTRKSRARLSARGERK